MPAAAELEASPKRAGVVVVAALAVFAAAFVFFLVRVLRRGKQAQPQQQQQQQQQQQRQTDAAAPLPAVAALLQHDAVEHLERAADALVQQQQQQRQHAVDGRDAGAAAAAAGAAAGDAADNDDDDDVADATGLHQRRVGKKKAQKLAAKEERRAARAAADEQRGQLTAKQEKEEARIAAAREREEAEERAARERDEKARDDERRRLDDDYARFKDMMSVDEAGQQELVDEAALLTRFLDHIITHKVVLVEDLAFEFKLRTADVLARIKTLEADGRLTGVIDDRGKYIYVSRDELAAVAAFIQRKGRVHIAQIADESRSLIRLDGSGGGGRK